MQEAGVATILHCLMEDVYCIVCVCVCVGGGEGEGERRRGEFTKMRQEKGEISRLSIFHVEWYQSPVVPPPGGVSAEMTPGKRRDRKSTPNL